MFIYDTKEVVWLLSKADTGEVIYHILTILNLMHTATSQIIMIGCEAIKHLLLLALPS